ncbi:MAG: hypothetical protein AAF604_01160 [Acidobacteriota bacterium]
MSGRTLRLALLVIVFAWMAPSGAALAVGLHVASHHHTPHGDDHEHGLDELIEAVTAAHQHDADLGHDADLPDPCTKLDVPPKGPRLISSLPSLERTRHSLPTALETHATAPRVIHRGPPDPLFTSHCSLLL